VALARAVVLEPELLLLDDFTDDLSRGDAGAMADAAQSSLPNTARVPHSSRPAGSLPSPRAIRGQPS
jgi:ABC-type uncharacterized transport system fused permease/ATPase subunit